MASQASICLLLALFTCSSISSSLAYTFDVGGKQGWVTNPSEDYNHWAGDNRFSVNDTIVFKYKNASESVLQVKKDDYDNCSTTNPIKTLNSSGSATSDFKFDLSGPFFFISGYKENCLHGQRLHVVVLAIRPTPGHPSPPATVTPPPSTPPATSPPQPVNTPPLGPETTAPASPPGSNSLANVGVPTSPESASRSLNPSIIVTVVLGASLFV